MIPRRPRNPRGSYRRIYSEPAGSKASGRFTGKLGATHCFYSIARDSANNAEAKPLTPDACQQLTGAAPDALTVYPNPTRGDFTVETIARQAAPSSFDVLDIVGWVIHHQDVIISSRVQATHVDTGSLGPGLYFVRMRIDGKMAVKKLVKM